MFPGFFDSEKWKTLMNAALGTRNLRDIFTTKEEFEQTRRYKGVNPRPGRNLIEKLKTKFIFSNPAFQDEMQHVCDEHWRVLDYKFVMGVPNSFIPEWLKTELNDRLVANLGSYVKEQYRDITYFHGIDFPQDIIDFPDRESDFITVCIYLDKTGNQSSPLYILPTSQQIGTSTFPHNLTEKAGHYHYKNDCGNTLDCELVKLTGDDGSMYVLLALQHSAWREALYQWPGEDFGVHFG